MARMVVTMREVGRVAHWCVPCRAVTPFTLVHEMLEGRVMRVVPVGGAELHGAFGTCTGCGMSRPLDPTRFPRASAYDLALRELVSDTHPALHAQFVRLDALRAAASAPSALDDLERLLGHPHGDALLALAEARDARLSDEVAALTRRVAAEAEADAIAREVSSSYPGAAGLWQGAVAMTLPLVGAALIAAPAWGWLAALGVGAVAARAVIARVREARVGAFAAQVLSPALARRGVELPVFLATLTRYRNGGPGSTPELQDLANDHPVLARVLRPDSGPP